MPFTTEQAYGHIERAHEHGRLAHALLITGPRGCGKQSLAARISWLVQGKMKQGLDLFGQAIISEPLPLEEQECDAVQIVTPEKLSRVIAVDRMREVEGRLHKSVAKNSWKVVIIMEADRMNIQAQNAFLKTLEEPPQNTLLLLLTSKPQALLATILSRCVQLPLLGEPDYRSDGGEELVNALTQVATTSFGTPWGALTVKAVFTHVIERRRAEIEKAEDQTYADEKKLYGQTTDGKWLKDREDFHKANARSVYLAERSRYFDILMAWMADALRSRFGMPCEDFPEVASFVKAISEKESTHSLLRRVEALEELRASLETNAMEQLALESGFLKAFG
jgi:DNA polymerase-3 subunit delta'